MALLPPEPGEAGVDEAGRGPLAGPVVAAAVRLPPGYHNPRLNDSKRLTEAQRHTLRQEILADAEAWGLGMASAAEIDRVNILQATYNAMHEALQQLVFQYGDVPNLVLVDGNRFRPWVYQRQLVPYRCVVKGDAHHQSIAAASILAKCYRDDLMLALHAQHPHYHWHHNKGYPTPPHLRALAEHGPTAYHRRSFRGVAQQ